MSLAALDNSQPPAVVYVPPVVRPRVWCHPRLLKSILEMSLGILGEVGEEVIARKHCFLLQLHFTPRRSGFLDRRSDRRSDSLDPRVTVVPVVPVVSVSRRTSRSICRIVGWGPAWDGSRAFGRILAGGESRLSGRNSRWISRRRPGRLSGWHRCRILSRWVSRRE